MTGQGESKTLCALLLGVVSVPACTLAGWPPVCIWNGQQSLEIFSCKHNTLIASKLRKFLP
jgi:hypothetical protein